MTPAELKAAADEGAIVLDMRLPRPFSKEHVPGAVNLQFNRADLVDRAELVLPKDATLAVHAEPEAIGRLAADLLRKAGYPVLGHLEGGLRAWKEAGLPVETTAILNVDELQTTLDTLTVVDAREGFEYKYGHVPGAILLPWTEALTRADELSADRPYAVICGDEVRSSLVASMLQRRGRDARLVVGGMVDWQERGYAIEKGAPPSAASTA